MNEKKDSNNQSISSDKSSQDEIIFKKKGRWISYIPAFFIALMTVTILILIIIGAMNTTDEDDNDQARLIHTLDCTSETASFEGYYSYVPFALEEPVFVFEQGFRWETLNSIIRVSVASYQEAIMFEIEFGIFNFKTYTEDELPSDNYVIEAFDENEEVVGDDQIESATEGLNFQSTFQNDNITHLDVIFNSPILEIDNQATCGYLYVKKLTLYDV
ncbi:MAG: hypothetical protein GX816_03285 [Erysipelotrichia bacterium]|jgi:hypothetical protein|nr:hypothetical protein [Bacilli bacterium]MDD4005605.1 hypothetical protein [Bacilli bacterium]NMV82557.1 hypothetical protein [Erysipelotrichia bacterium]